MSRSTLNAPSTHIWSVTGDTTLTLVKHALKCTGHKINIGKHPFFPFCKLSFGYIPLGLKIPDSLDYYIARKEFTTRRIDMKVLIPQASLLQFSKADHFGAGHLGSDARTERKINVGKSHFENSDPGIFLCRPNYGRTKERELIYGNAIHSNTTGMRTASTPLVPRIPRGICSG